MICTLPSIRRCTPARYRLQWGPLAYRPADGTGMAGPKSRSTGLSIGFRTSSRRVSAGLGSCSLGAGVELSQDVKLWCGSRYRVRMCVCVCGRGKVSLYSNRTRQGSTVRCRTGWLALGEQRLQVDSDGGSRQQNCHDFPPGILGILRSSRERCREVEGNGQWVLIDLCSPV